MPQNSRQIATEVLHTVLQKKKPLDHVLESRITEVSPQDVAFIKAVITATLRHLGEIDALIKHFMKNPFRKKDLELQILRLGICQLMFMDAIAEHAAINETVELTKVMKKTKVKGVINAVLRNVQREGKDILSQYTDTSVKNIPQWIRDRLIADYGKKKAAAMFPHMLLPSELHIRLRDEAILPAYVNISDSHPLSAECRTAHKGLQATELPDWSKGVCLVQGHTAQVPAMVMRVLSTERQGPLLDACAAPGGKTIQLCDYFPDREVFAGDINPKRLHKIKENLERCQKKAKLLAMDASTFTPTEGSENPLPDEKFAAILLDVPCSATGTSRKNPDVLYTRNPESVQELTLLQKNILEASAKHLHVGGLLVYSTCSLFKEEGEGQIHHFLTQNPNFIRQPIEPSEIGGLSKWLDKNGDLRTTPDMGEDGFYIARLVKTV